MLITMMNKKTNLHNLQPVVAGVNKNMIRYNNQTTQQRNNRTYSNYEIINAYCNNDTYIIEEIQQTVFNYNLICHNKRNRHFNESLLEIALFFSNLDALTFLINKKCYISEYVMSMLVFACIGNNWLSLFEKVVIKYKVNLDITNEDNETLEQYINKTKHINENQKQLFRECINEIKINRNRNKK